MNVEKRDEIFETNSENVGRDSGFGCQHFNITSNLFFYKKKTKNKCNKSVVNKPIV